jgi:hypothetical protein
MIQVPGPRLKQGRKIERSQKILREFGKKIYRGPSREI